MAYYDPRRPDDGMRRPDPRHGGGAAGTPGFGTVQPSPPTETRPGNGLMPPARVPRPTSMRPATTQDATDAMVPKVSGGTRNGLMPKRVASPEVAARPEPTREAAQTVGQGQQLPGVSGRLQTLTDSESPYIQRARTRARQYANRRGLMSSTIAAGAGEAAAIDAALPIAQADASIAAGERALRSQEFQQLRGIRSQEFMQARDHRVQQLMQQRGFDHATAQARADREFKAALQEREHHVQRLMQRRGFDHDSAQREADRELSQLMQRREQETQRLMQERGFDHATAQAEADRLLQRELAEATRQTQVDIAKDSASRDINAQYQRMVALIEANPNIPVERKDELREHFGFIRDDTFEATGAIYGSDIEWTSARPPPPLEGTAGQSGSARQRAEDLLTGQG